jgi:hypothetical protein
MNGEGRREERESLAALQGAHHSSRGSAPQEPAQYWLIGIRDPIIASDLRHRAGAIVAARAPRRAANAAEQIAMTEEGARMALREFRDAHGVEWKVWATIPEASALVRVDYGSLGGLAEGWLTFECTGVRKRLAPVPAGWDGLSESELEEYCRQAKVPPPRRSARTAAGEGDASAPRSAVDLNALDPSAPARTFTSESGRLWRVVEHERSVPILHHDAHDARTMTEFVLRFSSDSEVLELRTYPMAWARLMDDELRRLAAHADRVRAV